jgi:hypothetical protein
MSYKLRKNEKRLETGIKVLPGALGVLCIEKPFFV